MPVSPEYRFGLIKDGGAKVRKNPPYVKPARHFFEPIKDQGVKVQKDPPYLRLNYRIRSQNDFTRVSRRNLVLAAPSIILAAVVGAKIAYDAYENRIGDANLNVEQLAGLDLLSTVSDGDKVRELVAEGEEFAGEIVPVKLRDKPATETPIGEPSGWSGREIGTLQVGTVVKEAVIVVGNDPNRPFDRNAKGRWVVFKNPNRSSEIVFAYWMGFSGGQGKLTTVTPHYVR